MNGYIKAVESAKVKERLGYGLKLEGQKLALFRHNGKVYALRDSCPHQAAPISDGYVRAGYAVCPHHGWHFNVEDGSFINNEKLKIPTFPVKEEDGYIFIKLSND